MANLHTSIGDRIRTARERRKLTLADLGKRVGVSRSAVSQWELDATVPTGPNIVAIARALGVTERWLTEGKGRPESGSVEMEVPGLRRVAIVGEVAAGVFREARAGDGMGDDGLGYLTVPVADRWARTKAEAVKVVGPSMNLVYPEGTYLVCVPVQELDSDPQSGDRVIVRRTTREGLVELTVKELLVDARGRRWLWPRSSDPEHQQPIRAETDDVEISAVVVMACRPEPAGER